MSVEHLSRQERINAFIAATSMEHYMNILSHVELLISRGYVLDMTFEELLDKVIEKEYDKTL